jgi:hypothetical protein
MLQSSNYVTKRQSLRLLEDILIDRHNFQIMCVYTLLRACGAGWLAGLPV